MVLEVVSVPVTVDEPVEVKVLELVLDVVNEPVSLLSDTVIDADSVRGNVTVALLVMDGDKELEMVAVAVWDTDPERELVRDSVQEPDSLSLTDPVMGKVSVAENVDDLESVMDKESVPVALSVEEPESENVPLEVKEEVRDSEGVAEGDKDSVTDRVSDSDHDDVRVAEAVTSEADSVMDFDIVILMEPVGV